MNRGLKKAWDIATTVLVVLAILLAVLLVGVRIVGLKVFTVLSGSMEPVYHVGSLIYVKEVKPSELAIGDDITFMVDKDTVATHRIIEVLTDEENPDLRRFRTQGVNNPTPDGEPVHQNNLIGQPVFTIPLLGYVAAYIQNPPGTYIAIAIGSLLLLLVFLPDLLKSEKKAKDSEEALTADAPPPSEDTPPEDGTQS